MIIPVDHAWHLLAGVQALVLVQVADEADRRPLRGAATISRQWVGSTDQWLDALRDRALPAGDGFAWCAGEASVMAQARQILLQDKGLPREATRVSAYWKHGTTEHHETLGD